MGSVPDLARLVRAALRGDGGALDQLYRRFGRTVHGVLLARLGREDAEDVFHDVFVHAFVHLAELKEPAAFGGWICAIARRRAIDHVRRLRPTEPLEDRYASPDRPDVTAEARAALDAIQALPEAYRETLTLRLVEGLSGPEIAALTDLTPESVRVNLHRGFRLLRERLGVRP
jgi:RNA polymerase sigma-70 factor (ECF subfamily)